MRIRSHSPTVARAMQGGSGADQRRAQLGVALSALAFVAAPVVALSAGAPAHADGVRIKDAAARVIVIPENRRDVQVSVSGGDARLPPIRIRREGDTVVADGGLDRRIAGCGSIGVNLAVFQRREDRRPSPIERVSIRGVGPLSIERLPVITVRTPMNAVVAAGGAVWGEIPQTASLRLSTAGCGDWRVGDVSGALDVSAAGSGGVVARRAGALAVRLSGSGDMVTGDIAGPAEMAVAGSGELRVGRVRDRMNARVSGSGEVTVASVNGPVQSLVRGSGSVRIREGRSPSVDVVVTGSGDFRFDGVAGALDAKVAGSGDVRVAAVTGPMRKSVAGSGEVHVGR